MSRPYEMLFVSVASPVRGRLSKQPLKQRAPMSRSTVSMRRKPPPPEPPKQAPLQINLSSDSAVIASMTAALALTGVAVFSVLRYVSTVRSVASAKKILFASDSSLAELEDEEKEVGSNLLRAHERQAESKTRHRDMQNELCEAQSDYDARVEEMQELNAMIEAQISRKKNAEQSLREVRDALSGSDDDLELEQMTLRSKVATSHFDKETMAASLTDLKSQLKHEEDSLAKLCEEQSAAFGHLLNVLNDNCADDAVDKPGDDGKADALDKKSLTADKH